MRAFDLSSLSIFLLSLLSVGKTVALREDAFGVTNHGFLCRNGVYKKHIIFAAAKKLCDAKRMKPELTFTPVGATSRDSWIPIVSKGVNFSPQPPFSLIPLQPDGTLFPIDSYQPAVDHSGVGSGRKDPGPDLLAIDKDCNIIGGLADFGAIYGDSRRYRKCHIMEDPNDVMWNIEPLSISRENSPGRSNISPPSSPRRGNIPGNSPHVSRGVSDSFLMDS